MPIPRPLSAKYEGSFAYHTVKERLPTIMTRALDTFRREFKVLDSSSAAETDAKLVLSLLSELHYLMMTDKPLQPLLASDAPDFNKWTSAFESESKKTGHLSWFSSSWLFVECYLYRLLADFFLRTTSFTHYDPFQTQKQDSLRENMHSVRLLAACVDKDTVTASEWLQLCLWGNRCDLSLKNTTPSFQNLVTELKILRKNIIVDQCDKVVAHIESLRTKENVVIDYVLDNAGFELFTDLCLMRFLTRILRPCARFRIHVKSYPWFVSDVMKKDFFWMMNHLKHDPEVRSFGVSCEHLVQSGRWQVIENWFWTMPHDFAQMPQQEPQLYHQLQSSSLVLFKGDLNYRKLLGDRDWDHSVAFDVALREFRPSFLVTLRTNKADLICGLALEREKQLPADFLTTGEFAVIQVSTAAKH